MIIWTTTSPPAAPAPSFSPADLFAASEKGWWYDLADFDTLFQDIAGTIPVTAVGQFVGKYLDKSGNGNHVTAISAAARGVLQQGADGFYYIDCDGIDDGYQSAAAVNAGAAAKATMFFAFKPDVFTLNFLVESSTANLSNVTYNVTLNDLDSAGNGYVDALFIDSADQMSRAQSQGFVLAPTILSVQYDYTKVTLAERIRLRRNGASLTPTYPNVAGGNDSFVNETLYILGRTGTQYLFDGRLYGMIGRFAESTAGEVAGTEAWLNSNRIGAY